MQTSNPDPIIVVTAVKEAVRYFSERAQVSARWDEVWKSSTRCMSETIGPAHSSVQLGRRAGSGRTRE